MAFTIEIFDDFRNVICTLSFAFTVRRAISAYKIASDMINSMEYDYQ
ncbi:hypothetical protein HMPREF9163_02445 [Selenomonas sp. oral taxon 138 str. F0429]|nr:hypothetical protein HMPREF9163_02445 [Selenomonas sp. oral taxon 138 str. F0429]